MTLRQKTFFILSVTVVGLMALLYFAAHFFVMRGFYDLEEQQARVTVERVRDELFHDSLAGLSATTNDYGAWDKMYEFMSPPAPKLIGDEFQNGTLQGLRINSVLVMDRAGRVVFSKGYDFHEHSAAGLPPDIEKSLATDPWARQVMESSTHSVGVLLQPSGPVMIAACPITTTEHRGPVRGVVVMTRNLDPQLLMDLQTITRTHLSLRMLTDPQLPSDFQWAEKSFSQDPDKPPVQAIDSNTVSSYILLRDIHDKPALILRADDDRSIAHGGLTGLHYFIVALWILGFSFASATWLLLQRGVISPLAHLHNQVAEITEHHWAAKHVQAEGKDEISGLGRAINSMLDTVRSTEIKLDLLANNIQQIFWVKDASNLSFSYVSAGYEKIWGQPCNTLYSDPASWIRAVLPEDRKIAEDILEKQKKGETGEAEFRIIGAEGRICWISNRFFPVHNSTGEVQQYVGILEDITEYKDAEQVLLRSQDQLWDTVVRHKEKQPT